MPKKKEVIEEVPLEERLDLAADLQGGMPVEKVIEKQEQAKACSHTNRQSYGIDGKLEPLVCILPKGHAGDHQAPYKALAKFSGEKDPEQEYKFRDGAWYLVVEKTAEWSDAAGVPAEDVKPDYEGFADRKAWEDDRKRRRSESKL